jgi:hypothetical protein
MILKRTFKPDRRRRERQLLTTSVLVFTGSTEFDALGVNLSDYGMCLFAAANLRIGTRIEIEFLPHRSKQRVRVSGIVRHRALYLYGIEFVQDSVSHDIADTALTAETSL